MMMSKIYFQWELFNDGLKFQLIKKPLVGTLKIIPLEEWGTQAPEGILSGVGRLMAWAEEDIATCDGDAVIVPHALIADLSAKAARVLSLPKAPNLLLSIQHQGTIDRQDFSFSIAWLELTGQPTLGVKINGSILSRGSKFYRVPNPSYGLIEAISSFNKASHTDAQDRYKAWAIIQEFLPEKSVKSIQTDGYIQSTRIAHAAAFSLNLKTVKDGFDFDPILFGSKAVLRHHDSDEGDDGELLSADENQLLPPQQQEIFSQNSFKRDKKNECQSGYALGKGWYVVLDEEVRQALTIVRKAQKADRNTRREFAKNPRAFLREALGEQISEDVIEHLFIETSEYSERVRDVGLWQPRVLPWVKKESDSWLPEKFGLIIGGIFLEIPPEEIDDLKQAIQKALDAGETEVCLEGKSIPASQLTLEALDKLIGETSPTQMPDGDLPVDDAAEEKVSQQPLVLLIDDNIDEVGFKRKYSKRLKLKEVNAPLCLRSSLKSHQVEGLLWLQSAWCQGLSGVLLADDMGLGKTFQILAFFAWLRELMDLGRRPKRPLLIVAPTGLLMNWEEEHDLHLEMQGLGDVCRAYGTNLKSFRKSQGKETDLGTPVLDTDLIAKSDWVLTTYETLRDYQHSFAAIPFAAIAFDEMQKIKTPHTVMTEAAKAMNGDFIVGLTGTPIENRLADLWCLIDTIEPGRLKDLSSFSRDYEKEASSEKLIALKENLTQPLDGLSPIILRRMKQDSLEGLPTKTERTITAQMPDIQAAAYTEALNDARASEGRGRMLEALHRLRSISLHPIHPDMVDEDYIKQSARFSITFDLLDDISKRNEKVLIFLESLEMQPRLAVMIQQRYGLKRQPMLISGKVTGKARQQRVNEFQSRGVGFDVIILSPRAGGVGITLTAANHVIHLSRWWNPAVEDQCTDRIYRIGQTLPVNVYYPQAVHPNYGDQSFDIRLHNLLEGKRSLSREMLLPPVNVKEDTKCLFEETVVATAEGQSSSADTSISLDDIDTMEPVQFENWALDCLKSSGFKVNKTKKSWDCGSDGFALDLSSNKEFIIQCKHTQSGSSCDAKCVEDLIKARDAYLKPDAILIGITNAPSFTSAAVKLAKENEIYLVSRNFLLDWPIQVKALT